MIKPLRRLFLSYMGLWLHITRRNFIRMSWSRARGERRAPLSERGSLQHAVPTPGTLFANVASAHLLGLSLCLGAFRTVKTGPNAPFPLPFEYPVLYMNTHQSHLYLFSILIHPVSPRGVSDIFILFNSVFPSPKTVTDT